LVLTWGEIAVKSKNPRQPTCRQSRNQASNITPRAMPEHFNDDPVQLGRARRATGSDDFQQVEQAIYSPQMARE
jgi:hypothetical protein